MKQQNFDSNKNIKLYAFKNNFKFYWKSKLIINFSD